MFKNVGPEQMLAECDADRPGRTWFAVARWEAEFANHAEQVSLIGTGGAQKKYENQGGFNDLFDSGQPSKAYRDKGLNYGKVKIL